MRAHNMRKNNHILHGDETRYEANFTRSTKSADARDVFAVANHLVLWHLVSVEIYSKRL